MSNEESSVLNDHDSVDHLLQTQSSQYLKLQLQYNDRYIGFEKRVNAQFLPTTTIHNVIKDFLQRVNLKHIREEDVNLIDVTHDKRYHVPVENAHMTLNELNIEDGCTLCFQPSPTATVEMPSELVIYGPSFFDKKEYKWYENFTTLGMLLEYVIQSFSLESIERERIHLFHNSEELDLISNYDNLLKDLGITWYNHIDVKIIPSELNHDSFTDIGTSNGFLSPIIERNSINHSSHAESSSMIVLELKYTDHYHDIKKTVSDRFLPTATLHDVLRVFLQKADLYSSTPEDLNLVEINCAGQHRIIPETYRDRTLNELNITNGSTLYFESAPSFTSTWALNLSIRPSNGRENISYNWNKTSTTLGMLFKDIIKLFSLQSIEHERIRLTSLMDKMLDYTLHSDRLLNDLGITNFDWIYVNILPSQIAVTTSVNEGVHVECSYTTGSKSFDVPLTTTIADLKNEIEKQLKDRIVTDWKLFDRMHHSIDMSDSSRALFDFGIEPSQTVYASVELVLTRNPLSRLNSGGNTTTRSTSLIANQQPDEVNVICKVSMFESAYTKASINDTVAELLKKLKNLTKDRPLTTFNIWCRANNINTEQPNRLLSDFGVRAGDIIDVTMKQTVSGSYALESNRTSTFSNFDNFSRSQWHTSTPVGLANLGNTCYMNSALQCLAHAKPLTQFFLDGLTQDVSGDEKGFDTEWNQFFDVGAMTGSYADVLRKLWLPMKSSFYTFSSSCRPETIRGTIGLRDPRFATYDQQDAQELMTYLLDEIHKELKEKHGNESSTIIEEVFFGKLQSTVTCQDCAHQVTTTNIISFLPLPLTQQGHIFIVRFIAKDGQNEMSTVTVPEDGQVRNIVQAFAESHRSYYFFNTVIVMTDDGQLDLDMPLNQLSVQEVTLIEENDFLGSQGFDRLYQLSNKQKLTLEDCLRDFFSVESLEDSWLCPQETCKKHTKATKQLHLCSLPPVLIIQLKRFSHENGLRQKIETFVEYPIKSLDLSSFTLSPSEEAIYDLFAVCCHNGSIYAGHYIAYARHETDDKSEWYKFDDSYVSSCWSQSDIVTNDAYLLFYIRRETPKQATSS